MSSQTMADAFAPIEARYREQVMRDTWGHLAPTKNRTYRGFIVFAIGCYGSDELNPTVLSIDFKGLDDSPWLFDELAEFLGKPQWNTDRKRWKTGCVYRFDGAFKNYKFKGRFRRLDIR